ncbi:MAG: heavy metal sensor histidine kinase [Candidatus Omnitrophota bacterium]|jgi:two-component system heavy metal sensor histidine kinase CusS
MVSKLNSFGLKITLWYVLLFLISSIVISLCLYHQLKFQLYEEVDLFLADEMNEFKQFVSEHHQSLSLIESQMQKESLAMRKDYQMYYGVLDSRRNAVVQSSELPLQNPEVQDVKSSVFPKLDVKEHKIYGKKNNYVVRLLTQKVHSQNEFIRYLQVGMNMTRIEKTLINFRKNIMITVPIFFVLSLAGGFILAHRNLKPVSQMIKTASRISGSNLEERLPVRGTGDELDKLAQTFNNMINRIQEAYQKLSQFSSDVAHELRTPITSLMGDIEAVLSHASSLEKYRSVLTGNLEELARLKQMVNSLLFLSREANSKDTESNTILELNSLVRDIVELFEPVAKEAENNYRYEIPAEPIYIKGEKSRIEQIVSNLIDNAIRYSYQGGDIFVKLAKNGPHAEIIVEDKGIGIPDADKPRIFDRFYRSDPSRSRNTGGFGLGLSIVKSIVDSYNGHITFISAINQGTKFSVILPVHEIIPPAFHSCPA